MPSLYPVHHPSLGGCDRGGRGRYPAPPFNPLDYWATRKWVSVFFGKVSADVAALRDRINEVDAKTVPLTGRDYTLAYNEDLYRVLSEVVTSLGGIVHIKG